MSSYDPSLFNVNPYYDDFNEDKKFLRMLFRPGYAVQSRELTQVQTILQNQIERFGSHVFKDGTRIIGGEISTQTLSFVRLNTNTANVVSKDLKETDILGFNLIQKDESGNVIAKAKVLDYLSVYSDADPYKVAIISYLSGANFTAGVTLECDNTAITIVTVAPSAPKVPHGGTARVVATSEGIYFINGFFVKTENQIEPAYQIADEIRNFSTPTGIMGFDVQSVIVTEKDDSTIKDPANGSYNYNAPGAHRYKIDLVLSFEETLPSDGFIQLATYLDGQVVKKYDFTQYSELIDLFAKRTYDESGNYVVEPFEVSVRDGGETYAYAEIGSGKAYVYGYEFESRFKDVVEIPKARTTADFENFKTNNYYGNFIVGKYNTSPANNSIGSRMNRLFSMFDDSSDQNTMAYEVYGATGPIRDFGVYGYMGSTLFGDDKHVIFNGYMVGFEPTINIEYSTQSNTNMSFAANLSHINLLNVTGPALTESVNLYAIDRRTFESHKILSNITLYSSSVGGEIVSSRMPLIQAPRKNELLFPLNSNNPTTLIKNVDSLSYVHTVFRAFTVSATNPRPRILLNRGVDFNWCVENQFVPTGTDVVIDDTDGYYIVSISAGTLTPGTIIKVVAQTTQLPQNVIRVTAKITGDGDAVQLTSSELPTGSYYLVGPCKNTSTQFNVNPESKIRTKTLTDATEALVSTGTRFNTVNNATYIKVIRRNAANSIYSLYFQLENSDLYSITSITDKNGINITNEFLFDNGQRDAYYGLGKLHVKPEYFSKYDNGKSFTINVQYKYFAHSGYGAFIADSYQGISYDQIPSFVSAETGKSYSLANMADYRYALKIYGFVTPAAGTNPDAPITIDPSATSSQAVVRVVNGFIPYRSSIVNNHKAYLPRIDKIVVSKNISADGDDTTIYRIAGSASDSPVAPEDSREAMTLFEVSVPAYTFNATDIKVQNVGNERFTMKDISNISKKVENLEQYAILTDLESAVAAKDFSLTSGAEGIKRAILVDTFDGHSIGDVANTDYRCSIDHEHGELRPSFISNSYGFVYNGVDLGITLTSNNILCSAYTKHPTPILSQEKASETIKVNPFGFPNWVGNIVLTPHADSWYDSTIRPMIKNNDTGRNDAWSISDMNNLRGHGTQWNDWESIWTGIAVNANSETKINNLFFSKGRKKNDPNAVIGNKFQSKDRISKFTNDSFQNKKDRLEFDIQTDKNYIKISDDTLLNRGVVPMLRSKTLTFNVYNMKPTTQVYVFFDNININQYCTQLGVSGSSFITSSEGSLIGMQFVIPSNVFETGDKILRVVDDAANVVQNATTIAEATYYSGGIKRDNPIDIPSVRPVEVRKLTPNSNKIVSNPLNRSKNLNTTKYNQWMDPLAQTFEIKQNDHPDGLYLESIDLYFATKDSTLPVTIEICPTLQDIPHTNYIIPFSTVVKSPSAVTTNSLTPIATNFKFSTPVYLEPGQYSILIRANTENYTIFAAKIGKDDLVSGTRIASTFEGGTLFKAHNSSEGSPDPTLDIMFKMNRCVFSAPASSSITLNRINPNSDQTVSLLQSNPFLFTPPNVSVSTKLMTGSTTHSATMNRNFYLPNTYVVNNSSNLDIIATLSNNSDGKNTFMFDMDRTNVVGVGYVINSGSNTDTIEITPFTGVVDDTARYITRQVFLPPGQTAKELKVLFDTNYPLNTEIKVFAKSYNNSLRDSTEDFEQFNPLTIDEDSGFFVGNSFVYGTSQTDFREVSYTGTYDGPAVGFDTFSVKICLYSNNEAIVPVIKNLRIVALG